MPDTVARVSRRWLAPAVGVGVLMVGLFALVLNLYERETSAGHINVATESGDIPNRLDVRGTVVGADLVKGELSIRLAFEPKGDLLSKDGITLSKDLRLLTNAATGLAERTLPKNKPAGSTDVVLELFGGDSADYPFDQHKAELEIYLVTGDAAAPVEVPMHLELDGAWHGLALDATADPTNGPGHVGINFQIDRSATVMGVACFIMAIQMLLALALIALVFSIIRGRKPEVSMFSWMGAMMFAFPALRNASPGIPPVLGTLSDYLAFFWAESTVAIVLVISVSIYLFKPQK